MLVPKVVRGESFKASENVVQMSKAGSAHPLVEYGAEEHDNESTCYVAVIPGDILGVRFCLKPSEEEFVDLYIDGILRYSNFNRYKTMKHSRSILQVCQCNWRKSGLRGKLQVVDMVVKDKTADKDASTPSNTTAVSSPPSVGTIELRVLRKIPAGSSELQATRGPTFEEYENWWTASTNAQSCNEVIPPSYEIGFANHVNGGSGFRKNVAEDISGYFKWASFKFQYRSADNLRAAGFDVPQASASTSTASDNHITTGSETITNMNATTALIESYTSEVDTVEDTKSVIVKNGTPFSGDFLSNILQNTSVLPSIETSDDYQISPLPEESLRDTMEYEEEFEVVTPKINGTEGKQTEESDEIISHYQHHGGDRGSKAQDTFVSNDTSRHSTAHPRTSVRQASIPATGLSVAETSERPLVMKCLGILKDIRANEAFCNRGDDVDEDSTQSSTPSQPSAGFATVGSGRQQSLPIIAKKDSSDNTDSSLAGYEAFRTATAKSREPLKPLEKVHKIPFQRTPTRLEHIGGGGIIATPVKPPAPPNTPVRGNSPVRKTPEFNGPHNANFKSTYSSSARLGEALGNQNSAENIQGFSSSPVTTPPRNEWGKPIDWSSPPKNQYMSVAATYDSAKMPSMADLPQAGKSDRVNSFALRASKNKYSKNVWYSDESCLSSPKATPSPSADHERVPGLGISRPAAQLVKGDMCKAMDYFSHEFGERGDGNIRDTEKISHGAANDHCSHKRKYSEEDQARYWHLVDGRKNKRRYSDDLQTDLQTPKHTPLKVDKVGDLNHALPLTFELTRVENLKRVEANISPRSRKLQERREALARAKAEIQELNRQIKEAEDAAAEEERKLDEEFAQAQEIIAAQTARLRELRG